MNIRFQMLSLLLSVEPENHALQERAEQVRKLRKEGKITLPSSIELELATNPFYVLKV